MVTDKIRRTIEKHSLIGTGGHIVIGLSGGPDSVCLFHALKSMASQLNIALYAVHINHGLRPGAADDDQRYVEELCSQAGVSCFPLSFNCKQIAKERGLTDEEAGRQIRYESFLDVANALVNNGVKPDKIKIAVAHNAGDQAETVLFRLIRGTGTDGLAGIGYKRKEKAFDVIRPLLDVTREEIEAYCVLRKLNPRMDKTNLESVYTRNKIRLELLPYLAKDFNPNIDEALIRLSKIAAEDKEYLWDATEKAYSFAKTGANELNLKKLRSLPAAIRHRVIMKAFEEIGLDQDITAAHLSAADKLLREGTTSKTVEFVNDYCMSIEYETVLFYKRRIDSPRSAIIELYARLLEPGEAVPQGCAVFDLDKLRPVFGRIKLTLRTRQPGDYICLNVGRKKIQDFMVDQKIPSRERDTIPLVAIGNEVLWVISTEGNSLTKHRYSSEYKLGPETKKTLLLELICEI